MRAFSLSAIMVVLSCLSIYAEKKELDHTSFDDWKSVTNYGLTGNGEWAGYAVNPQEGDGILTIYNTRNGRKIDIPRGLNLSFTADGKYAVAVIKPFFQDVRKGKIEKKKDFDLPRDSLALIRLADLDVEKIGDVISYKIGKDGGNWVAYLSCDTALISPKALKDKEASRPLVVRDMSSNRSKIVKWVENFDFSRDGSRVALTVKKQNADTLSTNSIGVIFLPDTSYVLLDHDRAFYGNPVFDYSGTRLAYVASDDSIKSGTKDASVYFADLRRPMETPHRIEMKFTTSDGTILRANQYTVPEFSRSGRRLIAGVAPVIAPDDTTIVDFERGELDIWRWNAPYTPPQENKNVEKLRKKTVPVVTNLSDFRQLLITDNMLANVAGGNEWDGDYAVIVDPTEHIVEHQWNYFAPVSLKVRNLKDGSLKEIGVVPSDEEDLQMVSPCGRYAFWYNDKNYYTYNFGTGEIVNASASMPFPVWDTDDDHPMPAPPYGIAGWSEDDMAMLVYDKYDIWKLDPSGKKAPECLTAGEGRKRNLKLRYRNMDKDRRFLSSGDEMLLEVFDFTDKYNGLATMRYGKSAAPAIGVLDGNAYTKIAKSLNAPVYTWQRANFSTSPDMWLSRSNTFMDAVRLTDANPQMKDYRWGTAKLVKWKAYDGKESEGVLYVPDDIDPNRKYPMLCVFYETGSEDLYRHYTMEPSWSWVNYPFYVSRGYVIFVPDIHYTAGLPGESCYNYVCSGAEEMCRRYPWIDKERIGIDGQSWGGYQTAYLVTRTDMFACAGSGAPVSNMTSAFGGIRWESGDSRQGQYEMGQSRIGRNLWEAPELYLANSPVFHADRVKTPLLIMHNDNDGAVPWYQGIEMFMALRRLQKPVWMLQYNGEAHNIRARKNRKDITVRLQQFFDHYLKGAPMPRWMKEGIPAVRKGQETGFEY